LAALALVVVVRPGSAQSPAQARDLALVGGRVYPSPTSTPIDHAIVLIHNGRIAAIGASGAVRPPAGATVIDCAGKFVTAGFWNSHVHFTDGWDSAAVAPAVRLDAKLQAMLTRWGFTTVWDLGSDPGNTLVLRRRIESGEVPGPRILMAGSLFPEHGHPVYLPADLQLIEVATAEAAAAHARDYLRLGLDGIKLFTGVYMGNLPVVNMPAPIAKGAVDVAHASGLPVFTHPQNRTGVDDALSAGVDVLAHTIPSEGSFTPEELTRMKQQGVALIPTLALWPIVVKDQPAPVGERLLGAGVAELRSYVAEGGTILFGTDVGFHSEFDTGHELEYMGRAMSWRDILASLTTNPSRFFKSPVSSRVAPGAVADLVVLDQDPAADVRNFSRVAYTIRAGRIIYRR
jgi:imidazolonepropionase-like amidohydrolase